MTAEGKVLAPVEGGAVDNSLDAKNAWYKVDADQVEAIWLLKEWRLSRIGSSSARKPRVTKKRKWRITRAEHEALQLWADIQGEDWKSLLLQAWTENEPVNTELTELAIRPNATSLVRYSHIRPRYGFKGAKIPVTMDHQFPAFLCKVFRIFL